MIYSKRKTLKAPSYAPHHQTPPPSFPQKRESSNRKTTGIHRKKQKPPPRHSRKSGNPATQRNRNLSENPNPNGLDSRAGGNDEILDYGNLSGMIESIGKTTGIHRKKRTHTPRHSRERGNPATQRNRNLSEKPQSERTRFPPARE